MPTIPPNVWRDCNLNHYRQFLKHLNHADDPVINKIIAPEVKNLYVMKKLTNNQPEIILKLDLFDKEICMLRDGKLL